MTKHLYSAGEQQPVECPSTWTVTHVENNALCGVQTHDKLKMGE